MEGIQVWPGRGVPKWDWFRGGRIGSSGRDRCVVKHASPFHQNEIRLEIQNPGLAYPVE